ncbi:hypothetical protein [Alkalicoccus luteus]|uniref:Uncharacterized protein n=1 Tax=Alkalicoccus luteus TaxID=1237094 RepID=A0A969PZS3_9BACI|nr:hypothetical protein [Alkalicoccus luteus]NJP38537.1 hypothetical protein [Alkalicoccus luteus]
MLTNWLLKRKARRYKQTFEKVHLYPYPVRVAETDYYYIEYLRSKQPVGYAVFSRHEENTLDAAAAHKQLYPFYHAAGFIKEEARMRAGIQLDLFRKPLAVMEETDQPDLQPGYRLINHLLKVQLKYKQVYDEFQQVLAELEDSGRPIEPDDIEKAVQTAAELEVLQFDMVDSLSRETKTLREWIAIMNRLDLWEKLKRANQVFYQQLVQNESVMRDEAKKMQVVKHDRREKMIQQNADKLRSRMKRSFQDEEKELRYP